MRFKRLETSPGAKYLQGALHHPAVLFHSLRCNQRGDVEKQFETFVRVLQEATCAYGKFGRCVLDFELRFKPNVVNAQEVRYDNVRPVYSSSEASRFIWPFEPWVSVPSR
jgi:hypothetical protein